MVLAVRNPLVNHKGKRLRSVEPSHGAMARGAVEAARRGLAKGDDKEGAKRARLMIAARASVYVTLEVPEGQFTIIDPEKVEPDPAKRTILPFKSKTLIVHPADIDQAIEHFEKAQH